MKIKISWEGANDLAYKIIDALKPACERLEIAGSIRRQRAIVGDIEIVCIPKRQLDLFGNPQASLLTPHLDYLVGENRLIRGEKNGEKYKKFYIPAKPDLQLDLFITTPECWPVIFAIRTGSEAFSKKLVTKKAYGGLLPSDLYVKEGRVWDGDKPLDLTTEEEFLELCGGWIDPAERI